MRDELEALREIAVRYAGHSLTEQDTKNAIIEPILALFGWPKTDLSKVRAEYRHTSRDNPVDYALMHDGGPVLLVEAKALDKDIDDHKFITQNLAYANAANVAWALLTNGDRWDLYAVFERDTPEKRRVFSVHLSDPDFAEHLAWIRPDRVATRELDHHWKRARAVHRVAQALSGLVERRDNGLVDLLSKHAAVSPDEVRVALEVLRPSFLDPMPPAASPVSTPAPVAPAPETSRALILALPTPGTKPSRVSFGTTQRDVDSWRGFLLVAVELVHLERPDAFSAVFDTPVFAGKKRRIFARDGAGMKAALVVPGGYVEGNQSATAIVKLVGKLLDFVGIPSSEFSYATTD